MKFFITTHSNHFLDKSIVNDEVSIFQFEKKGKDFHIDFLKRPARTTLDILGVSNSSVLIANASIWVEGPTDRKYLSSFLNFITEKKGLSPFKEDIDYAFLEYGGSLLSHYLFDPEFEEELYLMEKINAFAISNKIYLLADNDNAKGNTKKGKRRLELEKLESENFKYQNTEYKEIENLLTPKIVLEFTRILLKHLEDFEKLKSIKIKHTDYQSKGLGEFYEELFEKNKIPKTRQYSFKGESGTLKTDYKFKLCDFVIENEYSYEDLTNDNPVLKKIIEELFDFINK